MRIAHIVNPVHKGPDSDLFKAQPITFETMRIAKRKARDRVHVDLVQASFPEDSAQAPGDFIAAPGLTRSVLDCGNFPVERKLPLLADLVEAVVETCPDADYFIYTNVDIALQPHFYTTVADMIEEGADALVINRRTIGDHYAGIGDLVRMYADPGKSHPGRDCFVFRREHLERFRLGASCIGAMRVGAIMALSMIYAADNFREIRDEHLTFHLGEDRAWQAEEMNAFHRHNQREWEKARAPLKREHPQLRHEMIARMDARDAAIRQKIGNG